MEKLSFLASFDFSPHTLSSVLSASSHHATPFIHPSHLFLFSFPTVHPSLPTSPPPHTHTHSHPILFSSPFCSVNRCSSVGHCSCLLLAQSCIFLCRHNKPKAASVPNRIIETDRRLLIIAVAQGKQTGVATACLCGFFGSTDYH